MSSPTRQQILDTMLEAIGSEGCSKVTVQSVLDRTGWRAADFYGLFPDTGSCCEEAVEAGLDQLRTRVGSAAAGHSSWSEKLRGGLLALLEFLETRPEAGRALLVEVHSAGPGPMRKRAALLEQAIAFVDSARAELEHDPPPSIAPEGVVAGIHAVIHSRLTSGEGDRLRELLPELMYFAVLPYFGAPAAAAEMRSVGY